MALTLRIASDESDSVLFTAGGFAYATYLNIKVRREMADYPESVGVPLRKARYFADINPDPARAMKAYMTALNAAAGEGMHPLSDPVTGIWIDMARFLENVGNVQKAIEVLEAQRQKALDWIEQNGSQDGNAGDRTRLLQKSIQLAHKIGALYTSPYCLNRKKSEEFLVWSVETLLHENERRRKEGLKPGEGDLGVDRDQAGAQLESLGNHYEERDNFYYAAQLFLRALSLKSEHDCHSVVLMNNIAAAIVQQNPIPEPGQPSPSPAQLRDSGKAWAKKALELGTSIKPPGRNDECDRGCVVATHNLGEFAEMDGNVREARERYEEAGSIAHAINFEEGVISANEGLRRLHAPAVRSKKARFW